jgi:tRNA threonylcarbamoyladenosine biosynthesis protein TsaB
MRVLSMDTATKSCSVAVVDNKTILSELTVVNTQTHSKHLMGMVDQAIGMAGLDIGQIDGISITKGPGSFTGLRIGVIAAKALAAALDIPIVGICTLEALAHQGRGHLPLVCPMIDARRGEIYWALFRIEKSVFVSQAPACALPVADAIRDIEEPCEFVGNGALLYRDAILDKFGAAATIAWRFSHTIRASTVASLGMARLLNGDLDEVETLVPYYIRKSDAEINLSQASSLR